MKRLALAFTLLLAATAVAHAQRSTTTTPAGTPYPAGSDAIDPKMIRDPIIRDENHIATSHNATRKAEIDANRAHPGGSSNFKAEVEVTNHAAQAIKSISWTATLTDHETGAVVRTYDVMTKARISPGSTKKLSKSLPKPYMNIVQANTRFTPQVTDLKVEVNTVTYADGTTSTTP